MELYGIRNLPRKHPHTTFSSTCTYYGMYVNTMALYFGMVFLPQTCRGLWQVFFIFLAIRLVQFVWRVIWKSRREAQTSKVKSSGLVVCRTTFLGSHQLFWWRSVLLTVMTTFTGTNNRIRLPCYCSTTTSS
jgi:hypothetical protein